MQLTYNAIPINSVLFFSMCNSGPNIGTIWGFWLGFRCQSSSTEDVEWTMARWVWNIVACRYYYSPYGAW